MIDASIASKRHLRGDEEELLSEADRIFDDFSEGRIHLIAPDHIQYEVPAAIRNAVRNHRLTAQQAEEAIERFLDWRIQVIPFTRQLLMAGYDLAIHHNCSLYDGVYLALAEATDCQLVHADLELRKNLGNKVPRALWIADYRTP